MPILGSLWFKSGAITSAQGINTVAHNLGQTPDTIWAQYGSAVGDPSLPLKLMDGTEGPTYVRVAQSNAANVTIHVFASKIHSLIH